MRELAACGTYAAWTRHKRRGEEVDEACRQAMKAYQKQWREQHALDLAKRSREAMAKVRENARVVVFEHYSVGGIRCTCCGSPRNLTIDHPDGDGQEHRLAVLGDDRSGGWHFYRFLVLNGLPAGYRVMCAGCNASKGRGLRCRMHEDEDES